MSNTQARPFRSLSEKIWQIAFWIICGLILLFLVAPILVIVPLSFNAEPYFTFTQGMVHLNADAYSARWYRAIFDDSRWVLSLKNSLLVAGGSTFAASVLGTCAALGLRRTVLPGRSIIMSLMLAPMIVPIIVVGTGTYFVFAKVGLTDSLWGLIAAHTALGLPFVVITVLAAFSGLNPSFERAASILGAGPLMVFRRVTLPLVLPGVTAGAILAFITSFDEVVLALFLLPNPDYFTLPRQMWSGLREQISPAILAASTLWIGMSLALMFVVGLLKRNASRLSKTV